jgi:hypothetical protein
MKTTAEIKTMCEYLHQLCDEIPQGLSGLKDALTFALLDLTAYWRHGIRMKDFDKALKFAESIPVFDDFNSDECCGWMLHDEEHLTYLPW